MFERMSSKPCMVSDYYFHCKGFFSNWTKCLTVPEQVLSCWICMLSVCVRTVYILSQQAGQRAGSVHY